MILLVKEMAEVEAEQDVKVGTHYFQGSSICAEAVIVRGNINYNKGIVEQDINKKQDEPQILDESFIFHSPCIALNLSFLLVKKCASFVVMMNSALKESLLFFVYLQFFLVQA